MFLGKLYVKKLNLSDIKHISLEKEHKLLSQTFPTQSAFFYVSLINNLLFSFA